MFSPLFTLVFMICISCGAFLHSALPAEQACPAVLMVRPVDFGFNKQTAESNPYQHWLYDTASEDLREKALEEFDQYVRLLQEHGVTVHVVEQAGKVPCPDAVFPNNWFSTHACGTLVTYPMMAENRRLERREDILESLGTDYEVKQFVDLSYHEREGHYLEGTGSLIFDYPNDYAYAGLSPRTDRELVSQICEFLGYEPVVFHAADAEGREIYHTNIILFIGTDVAVLCSEAISDPEECQRVQETLRSSGHSVVDITLQQVENFCGNILELEGRDGQRLIAMSTRAYQAFSPYQRRLLERSATIIHTPLNTIEDVGGGGARCMLSAAIPAGIHLAAC